MAPRAGGNTIGWQDKQDYRAKLTIAKAAVRQVQREEVKDALRAKDEARQRAGDGKAKAGRQTSSRVHFVARSRYAREHDAEARSALSARAAARAAGARDGAWRDSQT